VGIGASYWQARFRSWPPRQSLRDGYTLLVPVPGDLPVFLDLALSVCRRQASDHRVETVVLPDVHTSGVDGSVERFRDGWPGRLTVVDLPLPEKWVLPRLRNPGRNHGVQLIAGLRHATSTHVVLHDADLFLFDETAHEVQYEHARSKDLDVLGVSQSWDPWFAAHDRTLAATWEMCARTAWFTAFPPYRHIGHDADLDGERHTFDTTFWAQCHTDPARIAVRELGAGVVHFNYVISTYRNFQRHGPSFRDPQFRLLLTRLFIDLFDAGGVDYAVPTMDELCSEIGRSDAVVRYEDADRDNYHAFRSKLSAVVDGPWSSDDRRDAARRALGVFDAHYDVARC
jgi:hypothetical protein